MPKMLRWVIALLVIGCGTERDPHDGSPPRIGGTVTPRLPQLVRVSGHWDSLILVDDREPFTVTRDGMVVFQTEDPATAIQVFDSAGTLRYSFGQRGGGPGEFTATGLLGSEGDTLIVAWPGRRVVALFDLDGRFIWESRQSTLSAAPVRIAHDSIDLMMFGPPSGEFTGISRQGIGGGPSRDLLSIRDEFFREAAEVSSPKALLVAPPFVQVAQHLVVGNAATYTLQLYDLNGKPRAKFGRGRPRGVRGSRSLEMLRAELELAANGQRGADAGLRRRIDTLARETINHFSPKDGLQVDSDDRLWVIGVLGDSTFADAYVDTTFLGRHSLPCAQVLGHRGVALTGRWLALRCIRPGHGAADGFSIQLYRIN